MVVPAILSHLQFVLNKLCLVLFSYNCTFAGALGAVSCHTFVSSSLSGDQYAQYCSFLLSAICI